MIKGRDIICVSFVTWDDHWGTPQQWMSRLAKHNRIFYIDQPISPMSLLTGIRTRGAVVEQFRRWRRGPREVAPNIVAGAPPPILPLRYMQPMNAINAWLLRRWLRRQAERLGMRNPIFWNFQPGLPNIARAVTTSAVVYHCVDEFAGVPYWWQPGASVRRRDIECCREADVVFCTARNLQETRRRYNNNIHFIAEAADIDLFGRALDPATKPAPEIAALPGKIVGYIGVIDFRLDVDLVAFIAQQQPDWSIALVGPIKGDARDLAELKSLPNVHFFGRQPIDRLPAYLKAMDVCTIPYVLNEYTHHIFPLKLYEYMAAGKPIVATDMEEMRAYAGDNMAVTQTQEAFLAAIRDVITTDTPERAMLRARAAEHESWEERVEHGSEILLPMLVDDQQDTHAVQSSHDCRCDG